MAKEKSNINYSLKSISVDEFSTVPNITVAPRDIKVSFKLDLTISQATDEIKVSIKVELRRHTPFITIGTSCIFQLHPNKTKKKATELPENFIKHLVEITTGVARGVFHERLQNTEYNNLVLPLVAFKDLQLSKSN